MSDDDKFNQDSTIGDVMRKWPQTVAVVLRFKMDCAGCPLKPFHSVMKAATVHSVDVNHLLKKLHEEANITNKKTT